MPDHAGWALDRTCPKCGHTGRFLPSPSRIAHVNDYRCIECGHVWSHDKDDPAAPAIDITFTENNQP
jgi:rubredoxin